MADPSATPLTNADFRKLLATPRPGRGPSETPRPNATPRGDADKAKAKKNFHKPKPKPVGAADEEEDDGPKYRDRAEERRKGINPDYAGVQQLLGVIGGGGDVDATRLTVEESKYLGGDIEHTHLVKGLDYALLQKTRSNLEKQKAEDAEAEAEERAMEGRTAHQVISTAKPAGPKREDLSINHPVAKGIFNALFVPPKTNIRELFLPRRMAFVYDFEADEYGVVQDIPTTVRRSKADCPTPVEAVFAQVDNAVLERIAKIMSYIKTGKDGKKIKKKERDEILGELMTGGKGGAAGTAAAAAQGAGHQQQAAVAAGPKPGAAQAAAKQADDDEDIFGDAGTDYKPSVTGKKKAAPAAGGAGAGGGDDMEIEEGEAAGPLPGPPPPPGPPSAEAYAAAYGADPYAAQYGGAAAGGWEQYGAGQYGAAGQAVQQQQQQQEPRWRVRTRKTEERMVDFVDDAYGEYYPMAGGFADVMGGEDDEDAEGKAAKGAKGAEGAAGAAAAAGKGGKLSEKDAARADNQKLHTQLQKIEHILKEKGHDHSAAFGKTPGRGKTQTGEDPNLSVASRKKQRI